jgi:hypothetical protein
MDNRHIPIHFRKLRTKIVCFIIFMAGFHSGLFSQSSEYMMKAVALEKISLFILWPANTFNNSTSQEFVIAVLDQQSFCDILEEVYKTKKIKERKVKVVSIKTIQELPECQILFIPKMKGNELNKILSSLKLKSILSISDSEGFAEAGCFINFYEYENKLRFEINQKNMKEAGFTIDYRLLKVSKIINPAIE